MYQAGINVDGEPASLAQAKTIVKLLGWGKVEDGDDEGLFLVQIPKGIDNLDKLGMLEVKLVWDDCEYSIDLEMP